MADEKKEDGAQEGQPSPKGSLLDNKVVLLGGIVIVQAVLAIGLTQFVIVPKLGVQQPAVAGSEAGAKSATLPDMGVIVGLEEIIVSLQNDRGGSSFLRINVNLEVGSQAVADQVIARLPQLRDIVIVTLSSMKARELLTPEGTQAVRSEIFRRLAEKLPEGSLRSIYFSDLVIQ